MKIEPLVAALTLNLALGIGTAQGIVLSFEDDNIDFALSPTLELRTSGALAVGDILVNVFEVRVATIGGANAIPPGMELTGVAATQIVEIAPVITFGPVSAGLNAILGLAGTAGTSVVGGNAGEGATIGMWLNGATGGDNLIVDLATLLGDASCMSLADCILQASRGELFQVDGFAGDPDEFWQAQGLFPSGLDIGAVAAANSTLAVAVFNAAQTTFFNSTGPIDFMNFTTGQLCAATGLSLDGCIQGGTLSGVISGGQGLTNGAFAHGDLDARKLQLSVPEPGTLLLFAIGLAGLRAFGRT
jgi:hypothetical protein